MFVFLLFMVVLMILYFGVMVEILFVICLVKEVGVWIIVVINFGKLFIL